MLKLGNWMIFLKYFTRYHEEFANLVVLYSVSLSLERCYFKNCQAVSITKSSGKLFIAQHGAIIILLHAQSTTESNN